MHQYVFYVCPSGASQLGALQLIQMELKDSGRQPGRVKSTGILITLHPNSG